MATSLLSLGRFAVGSLCVIFPATACTAFLLPTPGPITTFVRLFGARDAVLGAYLWHASRASVGGDNSVSSSAEGADIDLELEKRRWRLRTALILGVVVDSIDVISSTVCVLEGNLEPKAWPVFGGGAALLLLLAWLAWPEERVVE